MIRIKKMIYVAIFLYGPLWGAPYSENGNGTVTDSVTGLIWQKCNAGQGTTIGNCSTGSTISYTWSGAISFCEALTLGGRNDWRLPNINELRSIVDYGKSSSPLIDSTVFPNTQSIYWSSTSAQSTSSGYIVLFNNGGISSLSKIDLYFVRCVTGP